MSVSYDTPAAITQSDARASQRLKVFMMLNTFETGGSERQFVAVARGLDPSRLDIQMGCIGRFGPLLEKVESAEEFPLGGSFLSLRAQLSRVALGRYLRSQRIDVVHSFDFYTNLLLLPTARLTRVPVVIGSHRQLGDLLTPRQFRAQAVSFRFCDRVVCNSRAGAERLLQQGLAEQKIVIIPNGLGPELFAEASPAFPVADGTLRIGMIARMNARSKNHEVFLRAAARLASKFPRLEFLLVGDGPLRAELEATARKLGIEHRVCFLGDRKDIPELFASMDVSVVPSASESLSNAVLESMAAGVAVVATNVGGTPEVVSDGETGLLVPPDHEVELAAAVERFITQPDLRAACAAKAKEFARAKFSLGSVTKRYEALYEQLLESKKRRSYGRQISLSADRQVARRLRIAIVGPSHRYVGGQSVQVDALLQNWRGDGEIEASFVEVDPELPKPIRWVGRLPFLRTLVREPVYFVRLWKHLKQADVAHVFSASYWSFLLAPAPACWLARTRKKKVLIHYHSGEALDHLRRSRVARKILKSVDCIVVPSGYLVDVFEKFDLPATSIANVVDIDQFPFRPRIPLRPRIICSRGFHPYYAVDDVVRAFGIVQRQHPDAELYLLGAGQNEGEIRELVKSLNLSRVEFAGPIPHSQIAGWYDRADIFVNASRLDNMPVSILEAFAAGIPVVTTDAGGIGYVVEHERTGLLCKPGEWQVLGEHVLRLLGEPALASRLAASAHEESKRYRWEAVREKWLETYRSL